MIETTLGVLVEAQGALERLGAEKLPVKTAYTLSKVLRLARPEIQQFVEQRNALIKELGDTRPNGDVEVSAANREEFIAKVAELTRLEVRLEVNPVSLETLNGTSVSAADLLALEPFIVGEPGA